MTRRAPDAAQRERVHQRFLHLRAWEREAVLLRPGHAGVLTP